MPDYRIVSQARHDVRNGLYSLLILSRELQRENNDLKEIGELLEDTLIIELRDSVNSLIEQTGDTKTLEFEPSEIE